MRGAGILLPVTALPSRYGIGCFSPEAFEFVDFLEAAGQKYWQILPLTPTGYGDSPYQSFSSYAGNPYLISPEILIKKGLLNREECDFFDFGRSSYIDYGRLFASRERLLVKAFRRFKKDKSYEQFLEDNSYWIDDYALFMSIKKHLNYAPLKAWNEDIKQRNKKHLSKLRKELGDEIEFHKFLQYEFYSQWDALRKYATEKGIKIIGDIPIYVSADSCDLWINPKLFDVDKSLKPRMVAGCPPDGFSAKGQLWGNPLYNWEEHRKNDFEWWKRRIAHSLSIYDIIRIDHFRGLDEYYSIKSDKTDATEGKWLKAPGNELLKNFRNEIRNGKMIAEDLGFLTDSVRKLLSENNIPGMKIIQFAFDTRDSSGKNIYLPHNYPEDCVVYTGTHDNHTLVGWLEKISRDEEKALRNYLCDYYTPKKLLFRSLISLALMSNAVLAVIPLQDYMGLDDSARINIPSTTGANWKWRLKKEELSEKLSDEILKLTKTYGR